MTRAQDQSLRNQNEKLRHLLEDEYKNTYLRQVED
jgi:hypothetical protein